jgi:hypothetical protein
MLRSKRHLKPSFIPSHPYKLFLFPEPDLELLGEQFGSDLRNLHSMKDGALNFPSDVDAEMEVIQSRVKLALTELADKVKKELRAKHSEVAEVVNKVMHFIEKLRLTWEETIVEDSELIDVQQIEGHKIELRADKGKSTAMDTAPTISPLRIGNSREFGSSSSNMDPEVREMFNIQQARLVSLIESDQRKQAAIDTTQQTMAQILNMLSDIQQRLPNPNP